jgi:amidophosphoribosyltransferase
VNTDSDSEILLNIFAEHMTHQAHKNGESGKDPDMINTVFAAIEGVMSRCEGGYAGVYLINGVGLVGFRDPHGIRPLVFGSRDSSLGSNKKDHVFSSESVAIDTLGFNLIRYASLCLCFNAGVYFSMVLIVITSNFVTCGFFVWTQNRCQGGRGYLY